MFHYIVLSAVKITLASKLFIGNKCVGSYSVVFFIVLKFETVTDFWTMSDQRGSTNIR